MPYWQQLTHKQFVKACHETEVAVLMTGALEAHGDHLPLGSDNLLPAFLAENVAAKTTAVVLPLIPFIVSWTELDTGVFVLPETALGSYSLRLECVE
jgi:creatinine amidohydrolase/Fe(II)-dependent formamide hydrolase-like protein